MRTAGNESVLAATFRSMAFDWLFGPPVTESRAHPQKTLRIRSLVLSLDAIRAVHGKIVQDGRLVPPELSVVPVKGFIPARTISLGDLGGLPDWELQSVVLQCSGQLTIDFRSGTEPLLRAGTGAAEELSRSIAADLVKQARRPRVDWWALRSRVPALAFVGMWIGWVLYLVDSRPPISLAVALTLALGLLSMLTWRLLRSTNPYGRPYPGHKIVDVGFRDLRLQTAARRWAVILSLLGIALGAAVTTAIQHL